MTKGCEHLRDQWDRYRRHSKRQLQELAAEHLRFQESFSRKSSELTREIEDLTSKYKMLMNKSKDELEANLPLALSFGIQGRIFKADLLVALSVRSVIRMNDFFHRLMMTYIEDILNGVEYNTNQKDSLIHREYSDLVETSSKATQFEEYLNQLKQEIEGDIL